MALIAHSNSVIAEQMKRRMMQTVLLFITAGIFLDITATLFMIIGSSSPFTLHGFFGYSALLVMLIDVMLIWGFYKKYGSAVQVPARLCRYTLFANS